MAYRRRTRFGVLHPRRIELNPIHFIVTCVIVGFVLWLINKYVPMSPQIKQIMNIGAAILLALWLVLTLLGVANIGAIRID